MGHDEGLACSLSAAPQPSLCSCVPMSLYPTDFWSSVKKMGGIPGAPSLPNWTCSRERTYSKV